MFSFQLGQRNADLLDVGRIGVPIVTAFSMEFHLPGDFFDAEFNFSSEQ